MGIEAYILDSKIIQLVLSKILTYMFLNKLSSYVRETEITAILGVIIKDCFPSTHTSAKATVRQAGPKTRLDQCKVQRGGF